MMSRSRSLSLALIAALTGCAPTLTPHDDTDAGRDAAVPAIDASIPSTSGPFTHELGEDGTVTTTVDATHNVDWHYLDLETGLAVTTDVPSPDTRWDLAFQRFKILSNGGVSGPGGAAVAVLSEPFDALTRAPETGYVLDAPDGETDRDTDNDSAFVNGVDDWYAYEETTHLLTPRTDRVYVVRTSEGGYFKVQLVGYYDGAGTPGFVRFRWARVESPGSVMLPDAGPPMDAGVDDAGDTDAAVVIPPDAIEVSAATTGAWTYLDVETGRVVSVADPALDTVWDVALSRTLIRTNGGTSGPGVGGARFVEGAMLDSITTTGTLGFELDDEIVVGMPGSPATSLSPALSDWYDYDFTTHTVAPKDGTFVVRSATGTYARLRIWRWVDGVYALSVSPIDVDPETVTIDVDASATSVWAYVDLHTGGLVEVADATADTRWDLGVSRTWLRTNGGTSAGGEGGALDLSRADLASITTLPLDGYTADSIITEMRPGGASYSGNTVLGAWYDYDPATHAVSPRATAFAVRLADGSLGKLRVATYASGVLSLEWSYAGPLRNTF